MRLPTNETEVVQDVTKCLTADRGEDTSMAMAHLEDMISHIRGWMMMEEERQALIDLCDATHETLCSLEDSNV
tara:strand:- start:550 stop:768 length:219 start_codon:yes stop_codon:yes gene_type:complete